jgi:putative flippase GtrA
VNAPARKGPDRTRRFGSFIGVGVVGFAVDAAVFSLLVGLLGLHFSVGRIAASLAAMTVTYLLNRKFSFSGRRWSAAREYLGYVAASSAGAAVNLAAFWLAVTLAPGIGIAGGYIVGAAAGLIANFLLYDKVVFGDGRLKADGS